MSTYAKITPAIHLTSDTFHCLSWGKEEAADIMEVRRAYLGVFISPTRIDRLTPPHCLASNECSKCRLLTPLYRNLLPACRYRLSSFRQGDYKFRFVVAYPSQVDHFFIANFRGVNLGSAPSRPRLIFHQPSTP